jgi:hypothetical protein
MLRRRQDFSSGKRMGWQLLGSLRRPDELGCGYGAYRQPATHENIVRG